MKKNQKIQRNIARDKKGVIEHIIENTFRIFFLMVALLVFFMLINFYINTRLDTRIIEAETVANRIIYSDAIMYTDPTTQRAYPGIIDVSKIESKNLDKEINYTYGRHVAAKLKLYNKPVAGQETFITEAYLNKDQFDKWVPIMGAALSGKGAVTMVVKEYPMTCYYDSQGRSKDYCTLVLEVVVPNS